MYPPPKKNLFSTTSSLSHFFTVLLRSVIFQEPVSQAAPVQGTLGPVHRQHDRVPRRVSVGRGLCAKHVRLAGAGHRRVAGPAQLRAGVPHAGNCRPTRADGLRRARVAGVRPEQSAALRVAGRRGFRRPRARPAYVAGSVRRVLLRHRSAPLVRNDQTAGECNQTWSEKGII